MAEIKEFKALRFTDKAGDIGALCCPPYDIIGSEEKARFLEKNEHNIIKLELPQPDSAGYAAAADTLKEWLDSEIVECEKEDSIYIYEEKFEVAGRKYSFRGFVCRVKLAEFSEGVVLPHEETLSKAKTDRFNLLNATGCSFSQIYSLYSDTEGKTSRLIDDLSQDKPIHSFTDSDGVTHSLWVINKGEQTAELCRQFEERKLYIADGHHRYETALNFRRYLKENGIDCPSAEYVMMFLIDMENSGLVVFPTHRIVKDLKNFNSGSLIDACHKYFDVEQTELIEEKLAKAYEDGKKAFGYYDGEKKYLITLRDITVLDKLYPEKSEYLRRLDVTVLHSLVLEELLGIDKANMANQVNLTYTRDINEAYTAAENNANCCFILNPTRMSEIAGVAAAGEKMPQKSTYFYPKLTTGLVMNKIK